MRNVSTYVAMMLAGMAALSPAGATKPSVPFAEFGRMVRPQRKRGRAKRRINGMTPAEHRIGEAARKAKRYYDTARFRR